MSLQESGMCLAGSDESVLTGFCLQLVQGQLEDCRAGTI